MSKPIIAFAADHAGYSLKDTLLEELRAAGFEVVDLGTDSPQSVDYPDYANLLAKCLAAGEAEMGVAICGTGIGISIAANRHPHIRCALVHDETGARLTRLHNNANVIAFGARVIGIEVARAALATFLQTPFEGGRHAGRVEKLQRIG